MTDDPRDKMHRQFLWLARFTLVVYVVVIAVEIWLHQYVTAGTVAFAAVMVIAALRTAVVYERRRRGGKR